MLYRNCTGLFEFWPFVFWLFYFYFLLLFFRDFLNIFAYFKIALLGFCCYCCYISYQVFGLRQSSYLSLQNACPKYSVVFLPSPILLFIFLLRALYIQDKLFILLHLQHKTYLCTCHMQMCVHMCRF